MMGPIPIPKTTMQYRTNYRTIKEALADGWRRVNRRTDRDVTEPPWIGYDWESADGQIATLVTFSEERNRIGQLGCGVYMFRT